MLIRSALAAVEAIAGPSRQVLRSTGRPRTLTTKAPGPKNPPTPATSSTNPTSSTKPIVLYEGPAQQAPHITYTLLCSFSFTGLVAGYNLGRFMSWPLDPKEAQLVDWKKRIPLGAVIAVLGATTGGMFKYVSARNIIKMTLQEVKGQRLLTCTTATSPLFPRGMFRPKYKAAILSGRSDQDFVVPLSKCVRVRGSAVAQGWVDERTGGNERRTILLNIGGDDHTADGSGSIEPPKSTFEHFTWKWVRGSPETPKFWSRQAFDDLMPQIHEAKKQGSRIGTKGGR